MLKGYLKKIRLFSVILFLIWIFLFGQVIQLKYNGITLTIIFAIFLLSILIKPPERLSIADIFFLLYISITILGINFYEFKLITLRHHIINIMPIFLLYFSLKDMGQKEISIISLTILFLSLLITYIGYYELIFKKNIIYELWIINPYYRRFLYQTPRMMSVMVHPTVFGSLILGTVPFSFFIFEYFKKMRIFSSFAIPLLITGVILSFSRGNLLGLLGLTVFYLYLNKKRGVIKFIILLFVILIFFSSTLLKNNLSFNRFSSEAVFSNWWEIELDNLKIIRKIIKEHPLIGIGPFHYRIKFNKYITEKRKNIEELIKRKGYNPEEWRVPDNMYLSILAENGLLGFVFFFLFLFFLFKKALYSIKLIVGLNKKNIIISSLSGITGLLISMNTYDLFYWLNPTLLFWFLISLIRGLTDEF